MEFILVSDIHVDDIKQLELLIVFDHYLNLLMLKVRLKKHFSAESRYIDDMTYRHVDIILNTMIFPAFWIYQMYFYSITIFQGRHVENNLVIKNSLKRIQS